MDLNKNASSQSLNKQKYEQKHTKIFTLAKHAKVFNYQNRLLVNAQTYSMTAASYENCSATVRTTSRSQLLL